MCDLSADKRFGPALMAVFGAISLLAACHPEQPVQRASEGPLGPVVHPSVIPVDQDIDLSQQPPSQQPHQWKPGDPVREVRDFETRFYEKAPGRLNGFTDPQEQDHGGMDQPMDDSEPIHDPERSRSIRPLLNFEGIPATGANVPDPIGDVGPDHYIQAVNSAFRIFDKSGNPLTSPLMISTLWSGVGGPCVDKNSTDPVVRYDALADRWLISQWTGPGDMSVIWECIAISKTADPVTGGWYLYEFPSIDYSTDKGFFLDYPKIGVWPDAYYMGTSRGYPNFGIDVWALDRNKMLTGQPAGAVRFFIPPPAVFLMPADLDGTAPPEATPGFFARQVDGQLFSGEDRVEVFEFRIDWGDTSKASFTQVANLPTLPFDPVLCTTGFLAYCVPQPPVGPLLESLPAAPMWRLQYRNFGEYETLVFNHTVDIDGTDHAGIRWYELRRRPALGWAIHQQGDHSSPELDFWMASMAMNGKGDIALGYAVSGVEEYPGIRVGGRLAIDQPGSMPHAELNAQAGGGYQTIPNQRYGDYSSMDVDPEDDCTFWYTQQYYPSTSKAGWRTRIVSLVLSECG